MRMSKRASKGSGHLARQRKQAGQGGDQEAQTRAGLEMDISEPGKAEGWDLVMDLFSRVKTKVKLWVQSINV